MNATKTGLRVRAPVQGKPLLKPRGNEANAKLEPGPDQMLSLRGAPISRVGIAAGSDH